MLKMLFAAAVVAGILFLAVQVMHKNHVSGGVPGSPQQINVKVPNPLGGGQPSSNDKIYVP